MKPGDFLTAASIRVAHETGHTTFNAPEGQGVVVLLLGTVKADGSEEFDADVALERLGWHFRGTRAPADTLPKGQDGEAGLVRSKGGAVGGEAGEAPKRKQA